MPKILIVDDSKATRIAIRRIVESLGFDADEAENGRAALDHCLAAGPPDCVLLDLNMPVLDGISCLRAMRKHERLKDCVVVVCSTNNTLPQIREAVAAGANEYVMKPFTVEILTEKLRQAGILK